MKPKRVKIEQVFSGKIFEVQREYWQLSQGVFLRDVVHHPGAVAVLPLLSPDKVVLVRQFRPAVNEFLLEIPAGLCEPNEKPEETAKREIAEEIGGEVEELKKLATFYSSPGFTDEVLYLFSARLRSLHEPSPDADEELERVVVELAEFQRWLSDGTIKDAKTLIAGLLLKSGST